jgi:hypothetical protein
MSEQANMYGAAEDNLSSTTDSALDLVGDWFAEWFCHLTFGYVGDCPTESSWLEFEPLQWAWTIVLFLFIWRVVLKRG